jgi:hypothetical protein
MTLPTIPQSQQSVDHAKITGPFTSVEDIRDAMADPRYSKDTAYQDHIVTRLDATPPEVFTTSRNARRDEVVEAVNAERQAHEDELNQVAATLDYSSITPILDSAELISLMRDPRYTSLHGHAFRQWVEMRLAVTPENPLLGISTKVIDRQVKRHQMGTE